MAHPKVLAHLEASGVPYTIHRHADLGVPIRSPQDFAQALGYELARITKSLLLRCAREGQYALVVCPVPAKVNFPLVAGQLGCKRVEMAGAAELREHLDYPPTGVSPIGAGAIAVFLDQSLLTFPTVLIGAGAAGVEIELAPADLCDLTRAVVLPLVG